MFYILIISVGMIIYDEFYDEIIIKFIIYNHTNVNVSYLYTYFANIFHLRQIITYGVVIWLSINKNNVLRVCIL